MNRLKNDWPCLAVSHKTVRHLRTMKAVSYAVLLSFSNRVAAAFLRHS